MSLQAQKKTTVSRKDKLSQYLFQAVPKQRPLTVYLGQQLHILPLHPRVRLFLCYHPHLLRGVDGFVISFLFPLLWILQDHCCQENIWGGLPLKRWLLTLIFLNVNFEAIGWLWEIYTCKIWLHLLDLLDHALLYLEYGTQTLTSHCVMMMHEAAVNSSVLFCAFSEPESVIHAHLKAEGIVCLSVFRCVC